MLVLLVAGCGRPVDGTPTSGDRTADPGYFFAGDLATHGRTVSEADGAFLGYLRALRRVDPCAVVDQDTLARVGELSSVSMLYAFDQCDLAVKLPGRTQRQFLTIGVELTDPDVESAPGSCDRLVPLDLTGLPGAGGWSGMPQPMVRVGILGDDDCAVTERLAEALDVALAGDGAALPARDGAARYPVRLAERDPCEVLDELGADVVIWHATRSRPYTCVFRVRSGSSDGTGLELQLQPRIVGIVAETAEQHISPDGDLLYLEPDYCSATVFVGSRMQRRMAGGEFVDVAENEVRPAVTVTGGAAGECTEALRVAGIAAKLFR